MPDLPISAEHDLNGVEIPVQADVPSVADGYRHCRQKERKYRRDAEDELRAKLLAKGQKVPPRKPKSWDSNAITPGTEFMMKVCDNLRWYIHDRVTHNPAWKNLTVILSDGSVPGEGEHKVMDFIRRERGQPGYNPNTTYV